MNSASHSATGSTSLPPLPPSSIAKGHSPVKQPRSADGHGWGSAMRYLSGHGKRAGPTEVELAELTDGSSNHSHDSSGPPSPASKAEAHTAKQRPPPVDPLQCTYGMTAAGYTSTSDGGASSAGLPSALTTPKPAKASAVAFAGLPDRLRAGLQLDAASSGSGGRASETDVDAASSGAPDAASSDGESGRFGRSESGLSIGNGSEAGEGSSSNGQARQPSLPASGSAQLDKYLMYLLTEAHPHKFMYYPEWGVSEEGCVALSEFIRLDRRIRVMTLSGNDIGDEGAELLADGLRSNRVLTSLDISNNKIGDVGALALAEALHHNTALTELQLQSNRIGDEGAEALAAALSANGSVKRLNLASNHISQSANRVVQHVLKTRDYKMAAQGPSSAACTTKQSSKPRHTQNKQSLQFDIELSEAMEASPIAFGGRSTSSGRLHVAGGTAIAALSEPTSVLESSLGMQVAHIEAGLEAERLASNTTASSSGTSIAAEGVDTLPGAVVTGDGSSAELVFALACKLVHLGYGVSIRWSAAAMQQHPGTAAREPGQQPHCFLRVMQPGEENCPLVIDPDFRQQFEVSPSTPRYKDALDALPHVLVLLETRLWHLTEALARQMGACFEATQRPVPPWRTASSMVAKWLPSKYVDVQVNVGITPQELQHIVAGMPAAAVSAG